MILQILINSLIVGSGYGLIAMAFRLVYSVSPFFNFSLGALLATGSYMVYYLYSILGLDFYLAVLLAVLATALFSYILDVQLYARMNKHGASAMVLMVVSLAVYTIFEASIQMIFGSQNQSLALPTDLKFITLFGLRTPLVKVLIVIANLIVFAIVNHILHKLFVGKLIRAVNDSPRLSEVVGINNNQIITMVSIISGCVLGIAGVLMAFDTGMEPTMGFNMLFKGMIGAIIGGMATLRGVFLGALLLALAENVGISIFSAEWRDLFAFLAFIIMLAYRPEGIFQRKEN